MKKVPVDGHGLGVGGGRVCGGDDDLDVGGLNGRREGDSVVCRNGRLENVGEEVAVVRGFDSHLRHLV